jgi:hypothetical protein
LKIAFFTSLWTLCLILLGRVQIADAQLSITANGTYTIGFDSTMTGVNSGPYAGSGFQSQPSIGQLDSDAWCIHWNSSSSLIYGGTQTNDLYAQGSAANAPVTLGGFYAFSGGNIGTGVALGIQPDGNGFKDPGDDLTLRIRNDTGHFITDFDVSYLLYVRNDQAHSTKFSFSYSTDDVNYTAVLALNYTSPAPSDSNGFVSNSRSSPISGLALPNGGNLYLRWNCSDGNVINGLRDEFALDDITVKNFTLADGIPTRGDVNQDNSINVADVQALSSALINLDAFPASHPMLSQSQISLMLNIDQESGVDNLDIQALLNLLANSATGSGQLQAVPEPAAGAIAICGALIVVGVRRRCRAWRAALSLDQGEPSALP